MRSQPTESMVPIPSQADKRPTLGVVMDPIEHIYPQKDSTLALLLEASRRNYELYYLPPEAINARNGTATALAQPLEVFDSTFHWYELGPAREHRLSSFDVILMRKDPPFNQEYIYLTYLLELAESEGARVVNSPRGLRDYNEKASILRFPQAAPPTLLARRAEPIKDFLLEQGKIVLKPLDGMGGESVFVVQSGDVNLNVVVETLTQHGHTHIMAQRYLPDIQHGDKRVLLVGGEPIPYMLARIPQAGESRGNLAAGGTGEPRPLGAQERKIALSIGPTLAKAGLLLVGLDMIGNYLTEINVTSPTCLRELDRAYNLNIAGDLFNCLERDADVHSIR